MPRPEPLDLAAGRFGGIGAPQWLGLTLLAPALFALWRTRTRAAVTACWVLVALAAVLAALLSHVSITLPAGPTRPGLGFALLLMQSALIVAVMIFGVGGFSLETGFG